jgi:antitoxin Phd
MEHEWQLQEAKARLSEVVQSAHTRGPQHITVRGKRSVVLISEKDFQQLQKRKPRFLDFIRKSPLAGMNLDLARDKSPARDVKL